MAANMLIKIAWRPGLILAAPHTYIWFMTESAKTYITPWTNVLLLCGKCGKKMKGGYGEAGKDSLRNILRDELKATGHKRDTRVIETKCMGICPKNAVTALNAGAPGRILTIPKGMDADEALDLLKP